jgi:glutamyl/glutaminyl-tRNA synthetase
LSIYKKYFVEPYFNLVIPEQNKELVSKLLELFNLMDYSSYEIITKQINNFIETNQLDKKNVFNTIRWILTRQETSPNIYIIIYVIGKEQCVKNISYY